MAINLSLDTVAPFHFATDGLAENEGRRLLEQMASDVLGPVTIGSELPLEGSRGIRCAMPRLSVMTLFFRAVPLSMRGAGVPGDRSVLLLRSMEGAMTVRQAGRTLEAASGESLFLLAALPYECDLPAGGRIDCGHFPVTNVPLTQGRLENMTLRRIPQDFPPLQLLITYGAYLLMRGPHSSTEASMVSTHFDETLPLVIAYLDDVTGTRVRSARLGDIAAYIDENLHDPELTVAAVADAFSITPRAIQKLFQRENTTLSKYVLERRLVAAKSMIARPRDERPISAIAYDVGFGDLSYFNRSFRRHFGTSPSEIRKTTGR